MRGRNRSSVLPLASISGNSSIKNLFAATDFYTLGLNRLQEAQEVLINLENKLKDTDEGEEVARVRKLLASAQTDLMGNTLGRSARSSLQGATILESVSSDEQDAIRHAMGCASVQSSPDFKKYLEDVEKDLKSPFPSPTKKKVHTQHHRSRSNVQTSKEKERSPVRRRNSNIERLYQKKGENFSFTLMITPELEKILAKVDHWDEFDIWKLNEEADGHALSLLCYHLLDRYNVFESLSMNRHQTVTYLKAVEEGYNDVPYHNAIHAADVLHATHFFLKSSTMAKLCRKHPLMRLSAYIGAVVHDYNHPGTNNDFHKKTQHDLALIYNDIAVLENMHVSEAFMLLQKKNCDFLNCLSHLDYRTFRRLVISMVLHTDMAKHQEQVRNLKHTIKWKKSTNASWLDSKDPQVWIKEVETLLNLCVHCADLSGPCRPQVFMRKWTDRVLQEFWQQGDMEKDQALPVGLGNDRSKAKDVPLGQVFFIDGFVKPLWEQFKEVIPEVEVCLKNLDKNLDYWKELAKAMKEEGKKNGNGKTKEGGSEMKNGKKQ